MNTTTAGSLDWKRGTLFDDAGQVIGDEDTTEVITSEYAEAMRHLIEPDGDEGTPELGVSEYCDEPQDEERDEEVPVALTGDWT